MEVSNYFKIVLCGLIYKASGCRNDDSCLYKDLFANYIKFVRPRLNSTSHVDVNVSLVINSLSDIQEKEELMILVGFFRAIWKDDFLQWNVTDYGGVDHLIIQASEIWLPDLALSNSATQFYFETYKRDFHVLVNNDGTVKWAFGGIITTNCNIVLQKYPFDVQRCNIEIENWMYNTDDVDLDFPEGNEVDVTQLGLNAVWHFDSYKVTRSVKYKEYASLTFTLVWQRKSLYYYVNIVMPVMLMLFVALGVFWLPAECGEKISLAITILLAFSVFQIIIMENTPVNSDAVPIITELVMLVMVLATTSLLTSMLVVYISGKSPKTRAPAWLRNLYFKYLAKLLFMSSKIPDFFITELPVVKADVTSELLNPMCNGYEIKRNRRFSVAVVNQGMNSKFSSEFLNNDVPEITLTDADNSSTALFASTLHQSPGQNEKRKQMDDSPHIKDIANSLKKLHSFVEEKQVSGYISDEWKYIGKITDRVMFFVTVIVMSISLAYISCQ